MSSNDTQAAWPSPARAWAVVLLLGLASIVSQYDRTILNLMVEPLKANFQLNDTSFSLLQTVAFGFFYVLACIPIGRLADRYQRRIILGTCLALFSCFAMASGLARSYLQLFLTRIGVAVGEASVTPAGFSLLSDLFPPNKLGQPLGAFMMSAPVGQGLGLIGGGAVLQWLTTSDFLASGPLANMEPWQAAFLVVGAPGLLLVPFFFLIREPVRRGAGSAEALPIREVVKIVVERRRALIPMFAGFCMVSLVSYTFFVWTPATLQRTYQLNSGQVGMAFGLIVLIFGTGGAFFGGWMTDLLTRRGHLDAPLRVAAFGFVGCGIFGALAPLMPNATAALTLLAPAIFLGNTPYACAGTAIQLITPNRARAQVTAIYITLTTLVGLVVGPTIVGLMTDYFFKDPQDIRYSLALVVSIPAPIMFLLLMSAWRPYRALRASTH
jgi:MFS family permease